MRKFSTSTSTRGISDVYSRLMRWSTTPKTSDIEASGDKKLFDPTKPSKASRDEMPDDSAPRRLKVLGKPRDGTKDLEWVRENFSFDAWPTNYYRKDLTASQIDAAVDAAAFDTLEARFESLKQISRDLKVAIPDSALAFSSSADLKSYLYSVAKQYNEKTPDAIYLDRAEFAGSNIVIEPTVDELKELKARNKRILRKASKAQQQQMNELLQ